MRIYLNSKYIRDVISFFVGPVHVVTLNKDDSKEFCFDFNQGWTDQVFLPSKFELCFCSSNLELSILSLTKPNYKMFFYNEVDQYRITFYLSSYKILKLPKAKHMEHTKSDIQPNIWPYIFHRNFFSNKQNYFQESMSDDKST